MTATTADATPSSPIATLFPGYFALVMSTGIVAVGAALEDIDWLAQILYVIAVATFVVLLVLNVLRLVRYPDRFGADLVKHAKGFSFLTAVAATNVLAAASIVVHEWWTLAWALWWASLVLWAALLYPTLIAVVVGRSKPGLESGINGTWFLLTVATESIAVVAGLLLTRSDSDLLAFVGLATFVLGGVLYVIVMTMVFLRWTFQPLDPGEADPPAWIAAGAVAITTLAGSNLLLAARQGSARLGRVAGVLETGAVTAWATSTFWFPLMIAIGVWRHVVRRVPLRYHPSYWAMVFPLGMYGVATYRMLAAIELDDLDWVPKLVLVVAVVAWTVTFTGLARHLARGLRR